MCVSFIHQTSDMTSQMLWNTQKESGLQLLWSRIVPSPSKSLVEGNHIYRYRACALYESILRRRQRTLGLQYVDIIGLSFCVESCGQLNRSSV